MAPRAYYNEFDPYPAQWLRNLIAAGLIPPGDVDERSIEEVSPDDLKGYTQAHFFAGIGGWPLALQLAGWPADRPVWTGSCPCQPISGAGQRKGHADERHLWPAFHRLIAQRRPAIVFGEQVAGQLGREWFAAVRADLEATGYACGAADLCAAGVGAPHIRQRLFWMAHADGEQRDRGWAPGPGGRREPTDGGAPSAVAHAVRAGRTEGRPGAGAGPSAGRGGDGVLADTDRAGPFPAPLAGVCGSEEGTGARHGEPERSGGAPFALGNASGEGLQVREREELQRSRGREEGGAVEQPGCSFWADAEWIACRDGKARPTQPGLFPLAHGIPGRVGRLRAYGNAIVPQVAAVFIRAAAGVRHG